MAAQHTHLLQPPTLIPYASFTTIFFLLIIIPAAPLYFNHSGFAGKKVNIAGDAYFEGSKLKLTRNSIEENLDYSVGRATNPEWIHLWDKSSGNLTDFSTQFSFVIYTKNRTFGDGMTFFLVGPNLPFPENLTDGGGLGLGLEDANRLLNSTEAKEKFNLNSSVEYQYVAVEFDTYQNPWDPSGTHVGININSMISEVNETWLCDIGNYRVYDARVDYDSSTHNLSVSFTGYKNGTQVQQNLSYEVDLRKYLPEWVIVGFSASTGANQEVHILQSWSFNSTLQGEENATSPPPPVELSPAPSPSPGNGSKTGLWLGLGVGLGVLVSVCVGVGLAWFRLRKRKGRSNEEALDFDMTMDDVFEKGTGPRKFSYEELVRATNNFAEAEKLGQGGFGGVYRGFLTDLNTYVAIKRVSEGSKQGPKEYATEVKIISQLRHRNLVQLIGWCHHKSDLLLIYEFMSNCSLDFHLFDGKTFLTWTVRYNIAQGLASALLYLQEEWERCVLHRDIKSSNIMLDLNFNAKLGDFGLARLVDHGKGSHTTDIAGTMAYMAPEYFITGKASKESDIFSFGVVALEIVCGRRPIEPRAEEGQTRMVAWVWELYGMGKLLEAADPKLNGDFDARQMERLMMVGLWCAHPDYMLRPSIKQANLVLNFEAPLPILPEKMPVPSYLSPLTNAPLASISSSTGSAAFEIQSSTNTASSHFTSSSAGSASAALLHTN